jgi:hypothetical protein
MSGAFASLAERHLLWLPDYGIGYLDVPPPVGFYGVDYFRRYRDLDFTDMGRALTDARLTLMRRHWQGPIVDVGIGGGLFVSACLEFTPASGWDVNPEAIRWLFERGMLCDPRAGRVPAVTMWDSIEHMADPTEILDNVESWAFVSTPVYRDADDVMGSKHYKPGEHLWYFSEIGLVMFMKKHGFRLVEANGVENALGREAIGSYAFRRDTS